jgi:signal transduction histidine kinase
MDWLTTIWVGMIATSIALSAACLLIWIRDRRNVLYLVFVLFGVSIAAQAVTEIWLFHATTIEEYGLALRWFHVPIFAAFCSTVGILHLGFGTDRLWLGLVACGLRFVSLIINFVQEPNLNYVALTSIETITVLGESVATVEGVSSPWMLLGQIALFTLLVYIVDAAIIAWRRDRSRRAVAFCGAIGALVFFGTLQAILVFWEIVNLPMLLAPFFLGVALVMGGEVAMQALRAGQLDEALQESNARLSQVSKAAAMSELSGALAHELNQPLGIILSNAEAAKLMLASDRIDVNELQNIVGDIISADRRAADVIAKLRGLLQRGNPELNECNINEAVDEALGHLARDFRVHGISLQRTSDNQIPLVSAERILIVQVIMNLLSNARDAVMKNVAGQRLVMVDVSSSEQDVLISITDNGGGLAGDPRRLFDAFMTTKSNGMGMGLAIAKSIVEAHSGRIHASSQPESGALFQVSIPRQLSIA